MSVLLTAAAAMLSGACTSAAQGPDPVTPPNAAAGSVAQGQQWPAEFDVALFGAGREIVPQVSPLTPDEEGVLAKRLQLMGQEFSPYVYSGCQNRAHATYLLLPKALREKAMKVWVLSPGVYSVGFYGLIGLNGDTPGFKEVSWGFHVAVAFWSPKHELQVIDSGIAPGRLLDRNQWFAMMKIPPLSFWTTTKGDVYQFNYLGVEEKSKKDAVNPSVWSGHYFEDAPGKVPLDRKRFERELARDAVGADVLQGKGCEALRKLVTQPGVLQSTLDGPVLQGCEPAFERYRSEQARLEQLFSAKE
jgi:hypothetical protein